MKSSPALADGPLAAIDLGSNSFRLEIGQVQGERYRRLDYIKKTIRLGAGLDAQGMLTQEATALGLQCLQGFRTRLEGFQPAQVRAVATQTLREARNRNAFLELAQQTLGHPVEIISGREEARLIYLGVSRLQPGDARRLVVDIGGRSTEVILGEGLASEAAESFAVGSVSVSMRFFEGGRFTESAFRAAQVAAGAEFEESLQVFGADHWSEALGSSGTVGAVAQVLAASGISDGTITQRGLRWCVQKCLEAGEADRLELPGLKLDRKAVLAGGLAILGALFSQFGITQLRPAKGALRQGVIFELHERLEARPAETSGDPRHHSVQVLQERFGVDREQVDRVRRVALGLFDQVCPQASAVKRQELSWACDLHEIGLMVSHHDHHRHSAYLLAHVDAPGFSQSQQRRIGALVLGQRGGLKKVDEWLGDPDYAWPLLCLRLAVIKCHARSPIDDDAWSLAAQGSMASLQFSPRWAASRPHTLFLLKEEAQTWLRNGALRLELSV